MSIYFSIDIETNGLTPGLNSMISLGCAAIDIDSGKIVGTFKRNLTPLDHMVEDASTMTWWKQFPDKYRDATEGAVNPVYAIKDFEEWVKSFNQERPVCAAWKPGFDIAFVRYYLMYFIGRDLFGRTGSGLDIKTLTAIALNRQFSDTQIATVPREWTGSTSEHSHDALEDAVEQAHVMFNAMRKLGVKL